MSLAEVRLQEGESIENALRRFKRKVQTEDIIKEVKRHSFYLKPGAKRRVKQALARKRARKKIRKDAEEARRNGAAAAPISGLLVRWFLFRPHGCSCAPNNRSFGL